MRSDYSDAKSWTDDYSCVMCSRSPDGAQRNPGCSHHRDGPGLRYAPSGLRVAFIASSDEAIHRRLFLAVDCFASRAMTYSVLAVGKSNPWQFIGVQTRHTRRRRGPPPGRRIAPPDDRLQQVIQYSRPSVVESRSRGVWVPCFRGDDIEIIHSREPLTPTLTRFART
jgi:hypothetical protein